MRLFYALEFDPETKKEIAFLQEDLAPYCPEYMFTRYENLLLTLCFLGEVENYSITLLKEILYSHTVPPLTLTFNQLTTWRTSKESILWLGLEENRVLEAVQKELAYTLRINNFIIEERPFYPHVTLARGTKVKRLPAIEPLIVQCDRISLMHSYQKQGLLHYKPLHTHTLSSLVYPT